MKYRAAKVCYRLLNLALLLLALSVAMVVMLTLAAFPKEGDSHGNHGDLKEWFDQLASKRGLCCSFADGSELKDVDWDTKDGHYRVRIEGEWVDVPDVAVITEPNRYGPAVVWPYKSAYENEGRWQIRCFIPGAGT